MCPIPQHGFIFEAATWPFNVEQLVGTYSQTLIYLLLEKDPHEMVMAKGIVGLMIEEKLEEHLKTFQQEESFTFTSEETRYLDLVKGNVSLLCDLHFLRL